MFVPQNTKETFHRLSVKLNHNNKMEHIRTIYQRFDHFLGVQKQLKSPLFRFIFFFGITAKSVWGRGKALIQRRALNRRCHYYVVFIQLFQFTLSDQSFKLTRQHRMVVWVEVSRCFTCRILMSICIRTFFLFLQKCGHKVFIKPHLTD